MSGELVLLDSVILIDHFNGVGQATDYIASVADSASISAITRAEVLTGFDASSRSVARALLDRLPLIVIDRAVADLGAEFRREHRWKLPDALQAAAARANGLLLATRNERDFPPDRHEFVRIPYTLERTR